MKDEPDTRYDELMMKYQAERKRADEAENKYAELVINHAESQAEIEAERKRADKYREAMMSISKLDDNYEFLTTAISIADTALEDSE